MGLNLPRLDTEIDCEPIGYPGLEVVFWLNPPILDYKAPESPEKWETPAYFVLATQIDRIEVPGEYTDDGEPETIEVPDARTAWELERRPDFDPQVLWWAFEQYGLIREERLQSELKN